MVEENLFWIANGKPESEISEPSIHGLLIDSQRQIAGNILYNGIPVSDNHPTFYIKLFEDESKTGFVADQMIVHTTGVDLLVVSENLKDFLLAETTKTEFISCQFLDKDSGSQYFIVNPLLKVDCTDDKKSDYSPIDRDTDLTLHQIQSLTIDAFKVPDGIELFLLGRTNLSVIIVSDRIKQELENRFSGCSFLRPKNLIV